MLISSICMVNWKSTKFTPLQIFMKGKCWSISWMIFHKHFQDCLSRHLTLRFFSVSSAVCSCQNLLCLFYFTTSDGELLFETPHFTTCLWWQCYHFICMCMCACAYACGWIYMSLHVYVNVNFTTTFKDSLKRLYCHCHLSMYRNIQTKETWKKPISRPCFCLLVEFKKLACNR